MATTPQYRPSRMLALMAVLTIGLVAWAFWPGGSNTPRLGLDLQGGTQVILSATPIESEAVISEEQLQQTVEIIRQRVNGIGVAEADVSIQGSGNEAVIVVSVPGVTQDRIVDLIGQTALLNFRPVQDILPPQPADQEASGTEESGEDEPAASQETASEPEAGGDNADQGDSTETDSEEGQSGDAEADAADQDEAAEGDSGESAAGEGANSGNGTQIVQAEEDNQAFRGKVDELDCTLQTNQAGGSPDNPNQWLGTCNIQGEPNAKYILQPAFIQGTNITSASAELPQNGLGGWVVVLDFDSEGATALADISGQLVSQPPPTNQFAIVLDGVVVSAPSFNQQILGGSAQIEGDFTADEAQDLANVLKFGALPLTLEVQAVESVSPTLGDDQLQAGILAGVLGLVLVGGYLLFYYRALGIVAVLSLLLAGLLTYASFVVLGNTIGFTLTLAGVAGAIVAIGITADSFVVYFERLRDEIRDGKSLRAAADAGWIRARRTLLAADFVSLLAAIVLYFISVGNVRGFAFALGLTTVMDVVVAFWFTRPMVSLLSRSSWMQKGSVLTGLSLKRLGVESLTGTRREKGTAARPRPKQKVKAADTRKLGGEV